MNITNCTAESRKKCRYCDANKEHIFAVNKIFVNFVALILTVYSSFEIKTLHIFAVYEAEKIICLVR